MKLEKIMKKEDLLKEGFEEITTKKITSIPLLYKSGEDNIYFQYKGNLYMKARRLG